MELLTGSGRRLTISEDEDPELMAAARVGLGAFGVITQVTIQCVSYYNLERIAQPFPFDETLDRSRRSSTTTTVCASTGCRIATQSKWRP